MFEFSPADIKVKLYKFYDQGRWLRTQTLPVRVTPSFGNSFLQLVSVNRHRSSHIFLFAKYCFVGLDSCRAALG